MARVGKRYSAAIKQVNREKRYSLDEALQILKSFPATKFDEAVDTAINLGIDPKQSDQMVRGAIPLPHGRGKSVKVLVFAKGEKEKEAEVAGADLVGDEALIDKIEKEGSINFDTVIATPDMMKSVSKLGKLLGPRGLMPNPKVGTVTFDIKKAVQEAKAGKAEFRADKAGIVHCAFGKRSFSSEKLKENFLTLLGAISKAKPATSKGVYLQAVTISTTMGPGIKLDASELLKQL